MQTWARALHEGADPPHETFETSDDESDLDNLPPERTFHKFGELPTEIRLKIWRMSFPDCEDLFHVRFNYLRQQDGLIPVVNPWIFTIGQPAASMVNQESRDELLHEWRYLPDRIPIYDNEVENNMILFNPKCTVLRIPCEVYHRIAMQRGSVPDRMPTILPGIRKLEMCSHSHQQAIEAGVNSPSNKHTDLFQMFPDLEEIRVIRVDDRNYYRYAWNINPQGYEDLIRQITEEYKSMREQDPRIKIPKITSWDLREGGFSSNRSFLRRIRIADVSTAVSSEGI